MTSSESKQTVSAEIVERILKSKTEDTALLRITRP